MKARGGGLFPQTRFRRRACCRRSQPGLFDTKHAAVGFAEKSCDLAQGRQHQGFDPVPQGVDTNMLRSIPKGPQSGDGDLSPEQVAQDVLKGLEEETFVILPHPAGAGLHAQEDRELRPLDCRDGEDPGEDAGELREVS